MSISFVRRKFDAMLGVATVTMSVNYIVMLSGTLIVGNLVGPMGLAGVNTCMPVFGVASFLASLLSVGAGLVFSQAMGAFDERRAQGVFSQTMAMAFLVGLSIYLLMLFGGGAFLRFTGVTGAVLEQAAAYWRWQSVVLALTPMVLVMEALVYADGDGLVAAVAGAFHVTGAIGLSMLFTKLTGHAGGVAAGTALTLCLVLAITSLHFLRKHNHLKFVRYWNARDLVATCVGSAPDATIYLCWGLLIMIINKFTVMEFGEWLLPVVALSANVIELSIVFDGVGEAIIPLGGMYEGEGNRPALRQLANHSAAMATLEGLVFGIIVYALAPYLVPLYGIRGEAAQALVAPAVTMIRWLAVCMPFMGFLMMANTHFLIVRHVTFAVSVTVVKDFVLPCICAMAMGSAWGFDGIWAGVAIGYLLAAAYPFLFVLLVHGWRDFPWLIPPDDGKSIDFAIRLTATAIAAARNRVEAFLRDHGVGTAPVNRVMFTIEEMSHLTLEKNRGAAPIAEFFVSVENPASIRLITRDSGKAYDISRQVKKGASFRAHAFASFLHFHGHCRYLNTLSCNRCEYNFER